MTWQTKDYSCAEAALETQYTFHTLKITIIT